MSLDRVERGGRDVAVFPVKKVISCHESATLLEIARRLAVVMGVGCAGMHEGGDRVTGARYFVPSDTLVGLKRARALGIRGEEDFFGGVVPYAFVASKAITHGSARLGHEPPGWSHEFARRVADATLNGVTVFSLSNAVRAAETLLPAGPLRIKPVLATAGRGQILVRNAAELRLALAQQDEDVVRRVGLVLEEHLEDVSTYSVGQIRVGKTVASYCGTQGTTSDRAGLSVYGGSRLTFARGDFSALLALDLPEQARLAVRLAQVYDAAAQACFPGFLASRRNYDVAQGLDARGTRRIGVLEQSWRVGGASSAEVLALEAFCADARLRTVSARSVELHGEGHVIPADAAIFYYGTDRELGRLIKFARLENDGNT